MNRERRNSESVVFSGSRLWVSNVYGAVVAGCGGGLLTLVLSLVLAVGARDPQITALASAWIAMEVLGMLALFVGNALARYPHKVVIEPGIGLTLHAAFKTVCVPVENLEQIRRAFGEGQVVRLKKRQGLLKEFLIHRLFGSEGGRLAEAIRDQISNQQSP